MPSRRLLLERLRATATFHGAPRLVRVARTTLVLGVLAVFAGQATFAAFSSATVNDSNAITAGTVNLADNDGGAALVSLSEANSSQTTSGCIRITQSGTLDSTVRIYGAVTGALAPHVIVTIERGTMPGGTVFPGCTGFAVDPVDHNGLGNGVVWTGRLNALPSTWGTGILDPTTGSPEIWSAGEDHVYRVTLQVDPDGSGQGEAAGSVALTWEGRNA